MSGRLERAKLALFILALILGRLGLLKFINPTSERDAGARGGSARDAGPQQDGKHALIRDWGSQIEFLEESRFEQPGTHVGDKETLARVMRAILRPQPAPSSSGRLFPLRPRQPCL